MNPEQSMDEKFVKNEQQRAMADKQEKLASRVVIPVSGGYCPAQQDVILALDIQYDGDQAHVAGDLHHWKGPFIGTFAAMVPSTVPYVPSYFCFREGPSLLALIGRLEKEGLPIPHAIIVDGHGIAHPRRFGVGCWIGIHTQKPTLGCAKEPLLQYQGEIDRPRGSRIPVLLGEETVGYILRTQDGVKPVYVSPGHLIDLEESARMALELCSEFRIPEPLRRADHAARAHCKGLNEKEWTDLGNLDEIVVS